jgi:hypothetical protein
MTAPPPVLSPSSILPPPSYSPFHSHEEKFGALLKMPFFFNFFNLLNLKLRKSGRVCICQHTSPILSASYAVDTGFLSRGKAARACCWPLNSAWRRGQEWVELYLCSPLHVSARPSGTIFRLNFKKMYHVQFTMRDLVMNRHCQV